MKKNIIITSGAWHHEIPGGAYKVATEFAEYLASQGNKVFFIAASKEEAIANPTIYRNVAVYRYKVPKARSPSLSNLIGHIIRSRNLAIKIEKQAKIDHVNGHDYLQFLGVTSALNDRQTTSTSFGVHSPLVLENIAHWNGWCGGEATSSLRELGLRRWAALIVLRYIERRAYLETDRIISDSKFTLDELSKWYPKEISGKSAACHLWVDVDEFRPTSDKNTLRKAMGEPWAFDGVVFFTLRRLVPRMGLDILIRAMSLVVARGYKCRLIIGGAGPDESVLKSMVKDFGLDHSIKFVGRVPDEILANCFQAPDCFVLPTRALECFGLIVLESYACGVPVIATPIGAIPEVMSNVGQDFLASAVSVEALANKLVAFLENKLPYDPNVLRSYAETFNFKDRVRILEIACFDTHS